MKKKKKVAKEDETRIYVVIAETAYTNYGVKDGEKELIWHPAGRQIAQAAHAVTRVRVQLQSLVYSATCEPITTIVLAARSDKELEVVRSLMSIANILHEPFFDTNKDDYGPGVAILTAVATYPIEISKTIGVLDHLPLWTA